MASVQIVPIHFRSTNYYVICTPVAKLLVDLGWPGSFAMFQAALIRRGLHPGEITHGFATHYHPDHAGLAEPLRRVGMKLLLIEGQRTAARELSRIVKPEDAYVDLSLDEVADVATRDSRRLLASLGIEGEILSTPGHSDDSMSLVLDTGEAFVGDLTWPALSVEEMRQAVLESWENLRRRGARVIYHGHGPIRVPMPD